MNHMKEIAQILGVELNEEFMIDAINDNNKYKLTKKGLMVVYPDGYFSTASYVLMCLLNGMYKLVKLPEPILDDAERKYLSRVIRPWRDKVEYIRKINFDDEDEFIVIIYRERESKAMSLPCFKKDTMYKGMEVGKEYSLEELEL